MCVSDLCDCVFERNLSKGAIEENMCLIDFFAWHVNAFFLCVFVSVICAMMCIGMIGMKLYFICSVLVALSLCVCDVRVSCA